VNTTVRSAPFAESADDVLDNLPCGIVSMLPDGTIIRVNAMFVTWTGRSREALLAGLRFQDLLTVPADTFYETHFAPLLRMQGSANETACQIKREGLEPLQVLINSTLKRDSNGEPLVVRTVIFNASDRLKYEDELHHAESSAQHLAAIVTSSGDAIISVGFDDVVRSWNTGATLLFGYAEAEAVGRTVDELIVPENMRAVRLKNFEKLGSGESVVIKDTVRHRKDGSLAQVEITASPMLADDGRVTGASLIYRDISERKLVEMRLKESEGKLRLGIRVAGTGLGTIDYVSGTIVLDDEAAAFFDLPAQRPLPRSDVHARFHPDDAPSILQKIAEVLDPGQDGFMAVDHRILRSNGSTIWVSARKQVEFSVAPDGSKRASAGLLALLDITERKQKDEALRTAEVRYRTLAEAASTVVWRTTEEGAVVFSSNVWNEITGQTNEERNGWGWLDAIHPEDRNPTIDRWKHSLETRTFHTNEFRVRTGAGDYRWFSVRGVPIFNIDGSVQEWIGANTDIHNQKTGEDALRISEIRYRRLFEAAQDGVLILDPATRKITDANPFMVNLLGYTRNQLIGKELHEIGFFADAQKSQDMFERLKTTRKVRYEDLPLQNQDGNVREVEVVANLYHEDGRSVIQCNIRDISERKQAENALHTSQERLRLAAKAAGFGIYEYDPIAKQSIWSSEVFAIMGLKQRDLVEISSLIEAVHLDDRDGYESFLQEPISEESEGLYEHSYRIVHPNGEIRWVSEKGRAEFAGTGENRREIKTRGTIVDISERKRAEDELRQSHDTYLTLIENNPFGVYLVDADFRMLQVSAGVAEVFGAVGPVLGRDFAEIVQTLWQEPLASEIVARFRHTLQTGERFHSKNFTGKRANRDQEEAYDWQIERVSLPHGRFGVVCYFYDMTERKRFEKHIQLLMNEVNHRAKNLLSVVQAVARQTARTADPATFASLLSERIQGLAASQDLLVKNRWTNVGVSELVQAQLSHFNSMFGTRVVIEGPPARLSPAAAQGIGMALHELTTNAVKYGALSNANGRIRIYWENVAAAEPLFVMHWLEEGGPAVVVPTRKGFGNRVIERMAEGAVDGKVEIEYRSTGFYWKLTTRSANLERSVHQEL
jgi:PAS domain S-box-containing protein